MRQCSPNQFNFKPLPIEETDTTLKWNSLSPQKQALFIKCILIIQCLSDDAVEEANEDFERIIEFYSEDLTQTSVTLLPTYETPITAKILPPKTRPSLVLDDF